MKGFKLGYLSLVALVGVVAPWPAGATVIYDTLSAGSFGSFNVSSTGWAADSFATDGNSYTLSDVMLALEGISTTGTVTVSLYSSAGNTPASALMTLGTIQDNTLPTAAFTPVTTVNATYALTPNTMYFIVLSGSIASASGGDANWERDNSSSGIGTTSQVWGTSADSGADWSMHGIGGDFTPFQMEVDANSSSTPEPGTVLEALGGLLLVLAARLKRREA